MAYTQEAKVLTKPAGNLWTVSALRGRCPCGNKTTSGGECPACRKKRNGILRRSADANGPATEVPSIVYEVLRSPGRTLENDVRKGMESRFGHDFSQVRIHTDSKAADSAESVNALAYTVGRSIVFGTGQYQPQTFAGRRLLTHELTHTVQQCLATVSPSRLQIGSSRSPAEHAAVNAERSKGKGANVDRIQLGRSILQRRRKPYIKHIKVHLKPPQKADLEWAGSPPDAPGTDHFTVSTGKGYSDRNDTPGTCSRDCCSDAEKQCAPPWNKPGKVGSCCTFYGKGYWAGKPRVEHNGYNWWTPIEPYYSRRGIALHTHGDVTGQPIGHGCVRMAEGNARRIYEYSNGKRTEVSMDGRAAPVECDESRRCADVSKASTASLEGETAESQMAAIQEVIPGLEGVMS